MKLSKTKKILLLGTTLAILTASIVVPIVLLNKDEKKEENDVEKLFKILQTKINGEKVIELSNSASGKIIADNQAKIIEKIKTLIGKENLKEVKIKVLIEKDTNISIIPQRIIIKLTKNEVSKEIEGFLVKKQSIIDVNKDIEAIKKVLDAKIGNDLIINLPSSSTGKIIGNRINKTAIIKIIIMLIDPSNKSGENTHPSLRGTSIQVSISSDAPISTTPQNIIVKISKTSGTTLRTNKIFQVKRESTPDEDIIAIKEILDSKTGQDLVITLPSDSSGLTNKLTNKIAIEKKLRILIDPSNTNGDPNHPSLKGTIIGISVLNNKKAISTIPQNILVAIFKTGGKSLLTTKIFQVKKA